MAVEEDLLAGLGIHCRLAYRPLPALGHVGCRSRSEATPARDGDQPQARTETSPASGAGSTRRGPSRRKRAKLRTTGLPPSRHARRPVRSARAPGGDRAERRRAQASSAMPNASSRVARPLSATGRPRCTAPRDERRQRQGALEGDAGHGRRVAGARGRRAGRGRLGPSARAARSGSAARRRAGRRRCDHEARASRARRSAWTGCAGPAGRSVPATGPAQRAARATGAAARSPELGRRERQQAQAVGRDQLGVEVLVLRRAAGRRRRPAGCPGSRRRRRARPRIRRRVARSHANRCWRRPTSPSRPSHMARTVGTRQRVAGALVPPRSGTRPRRAGIRRRHPAAHSTLPRPDE